MNHPPPKHRLWIDTDPGLDDALALLAFLSPRHHHDYVVCGVSTVVGNVLAPQATKNAGHILYLRHQHDIPLFQGATQSLTCYGESAHAQDIHGEGGLGSFEGDHGARCHPQDLHGVLALLNALTSQDDERLTIVALGPLTNLALALRIASPQQRANIQEIIIMGASATSGNITPYAEFNIYADPFAAGVVFEQCATHHIKLTVVGLEATAHLALTSEVLEAFMPVAPLGRIAKQMILDLPFESVEHYTHLTEVHPRNGRLIHDAAALLYLTHRHLYQTQLHHVAVQCTEPTRGRTFLTPHNTQHSHLLPACWVTHIDNKQFFEVFLSYLHT